MEGECKVQLDSTVHSEARREALQAKPSLKPATALLLLTLCLAAAAAAVLVFNRQTKSPGQEDNNDDLRHTLRQISDGRAAIHLTGHYNLSVKTSAQWQKGVDQSHSQGGLELKHNQIVIPQNGLYFVYSQASFRVKCSSSDAEDGTVQPIVHVSHTVKRWSSSTGDESRTILHSVRSACQMKASSNPDEEGSWFSSVYMGAVFNLMGGDKLETFIDKMLPDLEDEPGKTFFGVFAL